MAASHNFEHLPLLLRHRGKARLYGGGGPTPQTVANRNSRGAHSRGLHTAARSTLAGWQSLQAQRQADNLPVIPNGVPLLLQIDPSLDLDVLREKFKFEIVAEQEEGYVIVASEDIQLAPFMQMVTAFSVQVRGSASVASVHKLFDDPNQTDRLRRILSDRLIEAWPTIDETQVYVVDVGIACTGTREIPPQPARGKRDTDADWARKEHAWSQARSEAYSTWDDISWARQAEIMEFTRFYEAEILSVIDNATPTAAVLPDSFTIRLKIQGKGLKDFVFNYPYIFEVVEPEDIALPQRATDTGAQPDRAASPTPPADTAPAVCVIDSGIQEEHVLLRPAIDRATSHCFLPGRSPTDVADYVRPAGHGTRVAGAVLYGETVAKDGTPQLPFWVQNARVLDEHSKMPVELFPPTAIRAAVEHFHNGPRHTRIFNHSINADGYCRTRYMSAWAAEIDSLSASYDVLVVQSAGNLPVSGIAPFLGFQDHLAAGRTYPAYLCEAACRVANPAQSLQALTVGSVAYGAIESGGWQTFAAEPGHPSAFSRTGLGIWNVIKPEVVEHGGDAVRTSNNPPDVQVGSRIADACPELVRSTMFPPGPPLDRDQVGTSFAAPKVARIAAELQRLLPEEPALLYRALIVQSAQWPAWAETLLAELRSLDARRDQARKQELLAEITRVIRCIGFGVPDQDRATLNTDYRTTLIASGETSIRARECHVYQVPIPPAPRRPADDFAVRIDVTLSYVAQPRRTRRNLRRYLSTWVDWKSSKLGEGLNDFRVRAMREDDDLDATPLPGSVLPWALHEGTNAGLIRDARRGAGTVQKDWAIVKSNTLPDHFCIAVVGHQGWSRDPDSAARYTLAVTFDVQGQEVAIYEPLQVALQALQVEVEAEADVELEASE
ncbi:MAG TPA: S8 family peptidase [Lacipirellulaceae bacterium]|nr:S8 family peptidase [Lacipirellulaceae bacterium]